MKRILSALLCILLLLCGCTAPAETMSAGSRDAVENQTLNDYFMTGSTVMSNALPLPTAI